MSFNQIVLIGHLGKVPEVLKTLEKGAFVKLSLATTKKYIATDGCVRKDTQWHAVYVRNGLGKAAIDYLKKGSKVFVRGELRHTEWQDKDGQKHYAAAIYAQELIFLDGKSLKNAEVKSTLLEETATSTINAAKVADDDSIATK